MKVSNVLEEHEQEHMEQKAQSVRKVRLPDTPLPEIPDGYDSALSTTYVLLGKVLRVPISIKQRGKVQRPSYPFANASKQKSISPEKEITEKRKAVVVPGMEITEKRRVAITPKPEIIDDSVTPTPLITPPVGRTLRVPKLRMKNNREFFDDLSVEDVLEDELEEEEEFFKLKSIPFTPSADSFKVDRITTQTDLMAFRPVSAYAFSVYAIDEQTTAILPSITRKLEAVKPAITRELETIKLPAQADETVSQEAQAQNYSSLLGKLVKSSGIYALASFVSPLISLVLAPFLTKNLSHADYGALAVLNTAIALFVGITQLGLNHAFFRAYSVDYETKGDKLKVVSTLVALLLLISVPTTVLLITTAPWISLFLFSTPIFSTPIQLAALVVLLQNLTIPGFSWLRAENRAAFFSTLSIANLLVTLGTNILLVGVLHWGLVGALMATGSGYTSVVLLTLPIVILRAGLLPRLDIAWNLLSFGVPLVSSFISVWILQLSDRYLLSRFGSLAQTGSYAVAYTLGGIMGSVVLAPFSLAWPTAMFAIAKRDDAPAVFKLVFRWYSILLLLATFGFSLVSTTVLFLFFPPSYHSASSIIPVIAVSIMFYGIYDIFTIGIGVRRKTWYAVILTGFSALVNIGCNILLIPIYGSIGAALATVIAYMLLAVIAYIINQRIYPIPFEIGKFTIALLVGVALYVGASILTQHKSIEIVIASFVGALILYAIFLVILGNPFAWLKPLRKKGWRIV